MADEPTVAGLLLMLGLAGLYMEFKTRDSGRPASSGSVA